MIAYSNFAPMHTQIRHELDEAYKRVMDSNWFILGKELKLFEQEYANIVSVLEMDWMHYI